MDQRYGVRKGVRRRSDETLSGKIIHLNGFRVGTICGWAPGVLVHIRDWTVNCGTVGRGRGVPRSE